MSEMGVTLGRRMMQQEIIAEKGTAVGREPPIAVHQSETEVIESLQRGIHRLLADAENLADAGAQRKRPLVA